MSQVSLWEIPEACEDTEQQSTGSKVNQLVDLKGIEEGHTEQPPPLHAHTHTLKESIVCSEVVN